MPEIEVVRQESEREREREREGERVTSVKKCMQCGASSLQSYHCCAASKP